MSYFFVCVLCCFIASCVPAPIQDEEEAAHYLQKFGYLEEGLGTLLGPGGISVALKSFQRFAGITQTGVLDKDTLVMMNTPRCGIKDVVRDSITGRRRKRYARQGSKWRTYLSYRISKYSSKIPDRAKLEREIVNAFQVWSDAASLKFEERKSGKVDIDIRFERGEHGDGYRFDGPSKTLAHAFFPEFGGDAHFDDDENWTINEYSGIDLFQVAAHEFGHSLGLHHSDDRKAIMAPYYKGYDPRLKLSEDDVKGIQSLYGPVVPSEEPSGPPPGPGDAPDLCQDASIDTVTRTQDGNTYVFKGDFYWKILDDAIADGYPRKIVDDWVGLEGNLDASVTLSDGKTFFFKGGRYWRSTNKAMDSGYPKLINVDFKGIPDMLDAALVWSGNGKAYFFKGDKYWRYDSNEDPPVKAEFPKLISEWNGLPNNMDAAFQYGNNRSYFFKGDTYYRYDDVATKIDSESPAYPRPTSVWWFHCRSISNGNISI